MLSALGHDLRLVPDGLGLLLCLFLAARLDAWAGRSPLEPAS
jgi:hypothetical protein